MLIKHHLDITVTAKLHFFKFIASLFQEFLVSFQSDKPWIAFLSSSLENVIKRIMKVLVLSDIIEKASTQYKLIKLDLTKKDTCLPPELIKLGIATNENLKLLHVSNEIKLKFRKDCVRFLKAHAQKLQERSPLKYSFIRNAICLSPIFMVTEPEAAKPHFDAVIEKLSLLKWMSEKSAEATKVHYDDFLSLECKKYYNKFLEFDWKVGQLDKFLGAFLYKNKKFSDFFYVCEILLVLCHCQSGIEHGFSVNKDLLVENLGEQSLIRQCLVYNYFTSLDTNIYKYVIPNNLVKSCKLAYSKYKIALEQKKENAKASENDRK